MNASAEKGSAPSFFWKGGMRKLSTCGPSSLSHRRKQARLFDRLTAIYLPSVDGESHDRQTGQVDQGARTISPEELTGPHFADGSLFADHASPPLSSGGDDWGRPVGIAAAESDPCS